MGVSLNWKALKGALKFTDLFADSTGATYVGHDDTTVADRLNAVNLADYDALRAYSGNAKSVYITGYLSTSAPSGIAGLFTRDDSDTTSADNGGTIFIASNGKRWKRVFDGSVNVKWFGAMGIDGDAASIQKAIDAAPANAVIDVYSHTISGALYVGKPLTFRAKNARSTFEQTSWGHPCFIVHHADDVRFEGCFRFEYNGIRTYPIPVPTSSNPSIQAVYTDLAGSERIACTGILVRSPSHNFFAEDVESYGGFCGITISGRVSSTAEDSKNVKLGRVSVDTVDWGVLIGGGVEDIDIEVLAARNIKVTSPSDPSHAIYMGPRNSGIYYNKLRIGSLYVNGVQQLATPTNTGDAFSVRSCRSAYIGSLTIFGSQVVGNTRDYANLTIGRLVANLDPSQPDATLLGAVSAQSNSSITIEDAQVTSAAITTTSVPITLFQASSAGELHIKAGTYSLTGATPGEFVYFGGAVLEVGRDVNILYSNPVSSSISADQRASIYVYSIDTRLLIDSPYLSGESTLVCFAGGITTAATDRGLVVLNPNKIVSGINENTIYDSSLRYRINFTGFARSPSLITVGATTVPLQGRNTMKTQNTGATAMSAFPRGSEGQRYLILAGDANTSITHGNFASGFVSKTAANIAAGSWKAVEAIWLTDRLYELQRV